MDTNIGDASYIDIETGEIVTARAVKHHPEIDKANVKRQKHYEQWEIQPVDFVVATIGPSWLVGNVIKYVMRYNEKNGKQDIYKAIHYCEMLINTLEGRGPRDYGEKET